MPLIELKNVHWRGVLSNINLQIEQGLLLIVLGQNGSGKSSLLRVLSGWNRIDDGDILVNDKPFYNPSHQERSHTIANLPQQLRIQDKVTVLEWLSYSRYRFKEPISVSKTIVESLLKEHGLHPLCHRLIPTLSGGEMQRIGLISLYLQDSSVWLLDEPGNHLDPKVQFEMVQLLKDAWSNGQTMVLTTHNINLITQTIPYSLWDKVKVVGMSSGTIQFQNTLNDPNMVPLLKNLYQTNVTYLSEIQYYHFSPMSLKS